MRPLPHIPSSPLFPVGLSCRSAFLLALALFLDLLAVDLGRFTCLARKISLSSRRRLPGYWWHGSSVKGMTWALALAAGVIPACLAASKPQAPTNSPALVWPPPPAEPRITYLESLSGPGDFGVRPSGWNRLSNLVSGGDRGKEKLIKPFGIALDESDNLCVTDMGAGRVWFFDRSRKRVRSWDKVGKLAFIAPVAVVKKKNRFFVADSALQQVVAFDGQGKLVFAIDQPATRPTGLAISGEKLLVADSAGHRIVIFSLNGEYLSQFGQRGEGLGELNFPTHVVVNARGHILVTDSMNSRIQAFDSTGRYLSLIGSAGDGSGHFSRPKGVAVDQAGHVYVVDALFDNFQIFNPEGKFLLAVGMPGSAPGQFWMPAGIAISRDQRIFVADGYNGRIQVFQYLSKP
jgi:DNA-binding beta-propeller fold protein YncE